MSPDNKLLILALKTLMSTCYRFGRNCTSHVFNYLFCVGPHQILWNLFICPYVGPRIQRERYDKFETRQKCLHTKSRVILTGGFRDIDTNQPERSTVQNRYESREQ